MKPFHFSSLDIGQGRRVLALVIAHLLTLAMFLAALYRTELLRAEMATIELFSAATTAACLIIIPIVTARGMWSAGFLYALMLALFHTSIPFVYASGGSLPDDVTAYVATWYLGGHVPEAIYLSTLAILSLTCPYVWMQARCLRSPPHLKPAPDGFARVGASLVVIGVVVYLGYVAVTAPQLLIGGTYREYLDTAGGTAVVAGATLTMSLGLILAAVSGPGRPRTTALATFGLFSLFALSFGGRTAVMFPAVAALVAGAANMQKLPRARTALVLVLIGLTTLTVVRQVRSTGISAEALVKVDLNPVASLAETGVTVRTVSEVLSWRRTYHEKQYNGTTYTASSQRLTEKVLGSPRPEGSADSRYAGVLLYQRYRALQLGFSPVAEAFLNFGTVGVVVIFALLGLMLGAFDSLRLGYLGASRLGVIMYALAYSVRNASNVIPITIVAGLGLIWIATLICRSPYSTRPEIANPASVLGSRGLSNRLIR